ncbi:hypothetical protein ACTMU2_41160 [Cupriavidus basilensis]
MRGVDFSLIAQGPSCINFVRQLGGAIGVSLAGVGLQWRLNPAWRGVGAGAAMRWRRSRASAPSMRPSWPWGVVIATAILASWRIRPKLVPVA